MTGRSSVALAAALALALAGCLGPGVDPAGSRALAPLTEPTLAFGEFLTLAVEAEDGARLHVDVQLPEGAGPFPTLVEYTPYSALGDEQWGATAQAGQYESGLSPYALADYYVPRGYAVAVAHVRGTGQSEGCLTVGGPEEGLDGYAIVEHVAAQEWSNGRVAMVGTSYVGTTPIETAVLRPPHLSTIVPRSAVTNWYDYYFESGEQRMNGSPPPGASYPDPLLWLALGVLPGARTGAFDAQDAACVAEYTQNYWLQDDYNAFWAARNHGANAANVTAPVLYAQGFLDENVATNMVPPFFNALRSEKRLWLQQHGHGVPASKEAYQSYEHRWLDYWLLGLENGALDLPAVIVEDNLGEWRAESEWPPANAARVRFHASPDGALHTAPPENEGAFEWLDDGVGEMSAALLGRTWLRFESEPFLDAAQIAGVPIAHLEVTSDQADTQLTVLLFDRAPDGTESFVTRGYLDARHRASLAAGEDVPVGKRVAYEWKLHPRDHRIEAGHSLVLVVKSSDPYVIPDATRARNVLHADPLGSWIELPLVNPTTRAYSNVAPVPAEWA